MVSIISFLLENKYLAAAIGFLGVGTFLYFKGYSSGGDAVEKMQEKAAKILASRIQTIEASNLQEDHKREKNAESINHVDDINDLLELWDNLSKTPPSDKPE